MFERSTVGQNNRALFYGVRYTCYVEGGSHDHDRSLDALFWEMVLHTFRPDISFVMLPRGGKPIVEALAKQIVSDNIANTIAAIDSDYDEILGHRIEDRRVLYSNGYSWENDVFDQSFIPTLVGTLARKTTLPASVKNTLAAGYRALENGARRAIAIDLLALIAGSSVLPRDAPGRIIKADPASALPFIDRGELIKLAKKANMKTRPRTLPSSVFVPQGLYCLVGHCLGHGIAILIRAALKEMGVRKLPSSEHLQDLAIAVLGKHLRANPTNKVAQHHQRQCAAIP